MNEALLHFIWQFQYFNKTGLQTTEEEPVTILQPGKYNTNQGPDFLDAKVKVGNATWVGNVEIHIQSSDWNKHNHTADENYSNVILHVVWENDISICQNDGSPIPTVELKNFVPKLLLEKYKDLMLRNAFVPCEPYLPVVDEMKWLAWKERMAIERLQRKSKHILELFAEANNHWEEVFWWKLAGNFGIKINSEVFESIARSIPINIVAKHKNQIHQLESLLLGQAGLLNRDFKEEYSRLLQKEYSFLQKKYQLKTLQRQPHFLRMRPASFPTVRLAQLAKLVHKSSHLFSKVKEASAVNEIKELLGVTANDYWHYHYLLDEQGDYHPKQLGKQMIENIIINTIVPVLFAYGSYMKDEDLKDKAVRWLTELLPEKNAITQKWTVHSVSNSSALESQGLLELKNNYCDLRRCLECAVGNAIIKEPGS